MSNALTTLDQLRSAASQSSNATAKVASTAAAALEEMYGLKADRATFVSFSIPVTGWKSDSRMPAATTSWNGIKGGPCSFERFAGGLFISAAPPPNIIEILSFHDLP